MRIHCNALALRMQRAAERGYALQISEVSRATGIAHTTIRRLESNRSELIDFGTLLVICQYYGVGVGEFLTISDTPAPVRPDARAARRSRSDDEPSTSTRGRRPAGESVQA